jgi:hypothetical protein
VRLDGVGAFLRELCNLRPESLTDVVDPTFWPTGRTSLLLRSSDAAA